jgi:ABC-2 type transport system permease protein
MGLKEHLILFKEHTKINIATSMEYRASFFIQTTTMIANDFIWLLFWWIFFNKFNAINGWQMEQIIMLYAIVTLSYGLTGVFFGNKNEISTIIAEGKLDFYLSLPKNELFHLLISRSSWFSLGDIIFGLILGIISFSIWQWPLFLLLSLISATIIISFSIIIHSLAFYWGQAEETARTVNLGLISMATYPHTIFTGAVKFMLLTILPAGFISSIPVELLQAFNLKWFLLMILVAIIFMTIAIIVFKKGLKRYESGSMITLRV